MQWWLSSCFAPSLRCSPPHALWFCAQPCADDCFTYSTFLWACYLRYLPSTSFSTVVLALRLLALLLWAVCSLPHEPWVLPRAGRLRSLLDGAFSCAALSVALPASSCPSWFTDVTPPWYFAKHPHVPWVFSKDSLWDVYWCRFLFAWNCRSAQLR